MRQKDHNLTVLHGQDRKFPDHNEGPSFESKIGHLHALFVILEHTKYRIIASSPELRPSILDIQATFVLALDHVHHPVGSHSREGTITEIGIVDGTKPIDLRIDASNTGVEVNLISHSPLVLC